MKAIVLDDSFSARRALHAVLESCGLSVQSFGEAEQALSSLKEEPVDIVFCDLVLQGEDGIGFWKQFQGLGQADDSAFVLLSGLIDEGVRTRCKQEGIRWLLNKPFTQAAIEDLLSKIEEARKSESEPPRPIGGMGAERAKELLSDLSGLKGFDEVVILLKNRVVASSTPRISQELRTWFTEADQLLRAPATDRSGESRESVLVETKGGIRVAIQLPDDQRLIALLSSFQAIGPLRFFVRRRYSREVDSSTPSVVTDQAEQTARAATSI